MPRLHLFEFNDQAWVPAWFRECETDYLHTVLERMRSFDRVVPLLVALVRDSGSERIVDLCSGGGGPMLSLQAELSRKLGRDLPVVLTDLFPSGSGRRRIAGHAGLTYLEKPVDATRVPPDLDGTRTLFDGLHHFRPDAAGRILADAARARAPIGAFEISRRQALPLLTSPLILLAVLLVTPILRPFSWRRLVFTYLVPLLPLAIWWDGVVSNLRAYSMRELEELTRELNGPGYGFETGELSAGPVTITWLAGRPRDDSSERPAATLAEPGSGESV
jgi:hypothetical protein